jgi:steroid delta-isomerase-like uncharacterized protein
MPEDAKLLLRRFYDGVSAGNLDIIDELVADDFVEHEELPGLEPGKQGVKQFFQMYRAAFPDLRMEPHEVLADGDLVAARVTVTGTHQADFIGIPATGGRIDVQVFDMLRIRDGRAIEHWGVMDAMAMMRQLGVVPEAPA